MTIQFPVNPDNEMVWSPEDNPYNLIFQYDSSTNSWQIVGPDNLATTDYVDDKILETGSDVIRNYDLHTNVNTVSLVADYLLKSTAGRVATDSPNSTGEVYTCDQVFRDGLYGDTIVDANPIKLEDSLAVQVPDWQNCISGYTNKGEFECVGYDEDTQVLSYKYKDIRSFVFNAQDENNAEYDWLKLSNPGDTLEVNYMADGGGGDPRYALYRVLNVVEDTDKSPRRYGVEVLFVASATPDVEFVNNPTKTFYQFRNYLQPLNSSGGTLSGDLKIVSDSTKALSVWRDEEDIIDRSFNVNTETAELMASAKLTEQLTKSNVQSSPNLLTTLGFVNKRLGITEDDTGYKNNNDGPFLQIRGGTMTGTLTINRGNSGGGHRTLTLKGLADGDAKAIIFSAYVDATGDSVRYYGLIAHQNDIVNKKYVDDGVTELDTSLVSKLDRNNNGSKPDDNQMNVNLKMGGKKIINLATPVDTELDTAANVEYVQSKMSGKILIGIQDAEGVLYDVNGALYYNTYG